MFCAQFIYREGRSQLKASCGRFIARVGLPFQSYLKLKRHEVLKPEQLCEFLTYRRTQKTVLLEGMINERA